MFIVNRVYCRLFQLGFRKGLPLLPYRSPETVGSVRNLPDILHKKKVKNVLIITDAGIYKLGLLNRLEDTLTKAEIPYVIYKDTVANPTTKNVAEAEQMYKEEECSGIIGFGGGSSMDCAKACAARIARPNKTLGQMKGILKVRRRTPLLVAIPTTAGTGSETTLAAVIVDEATRIKYAINDFPLIPSYAVLDPKVTRSLPPFITATTGMDALTHAIEAYIGQTTTKDTRKDSLSAVQLIFENLNTAVSEGYDLDARRNMLRASFYAGRAFTKSYVGYIHAVAHSLGGKYNVPHGLANAILLPLVLRLYGEAIHGKLADLAKAAGVAAYEDEDAAAAEKLICAIEKMKRDYGLGNEIPELREEDIPELAELAAHEANPLYPVPVLMDARELEQIYRMVLAKENRDE